MGFSFRKKVKLGSGTKLNLSKSGVSTSLGKPGATVNFGSKGTRETYSLPGTGLRYTKTSSNGRGNNNVKNNDVESTINYGKSKLISEWIFYLFYVIAICVGLYIFWLGTVLFVGTVLLHFKNFEIKKSVEPLEKQYNVALDLENNLEDIKTIFSECAVEVNNEIYDKPIPRLEEILLRLYNLRQYTELENIEEYIYIVHRVLYVCYWNTSNYENSLKYALYRLYYGDDTEETNNVIIGNLEKLNINLTLVGVEEIEEKSDNEIEFVQEVMKNRAVV